MRAAELLRNKFGVSQLYKHQVEQNGEVVLEIYWHPLTIAERESIQKNADSDDAGDFAEYGNGETKEHRQKQIELLDGLINMLDDILECAK